MADAEIRKEAAGEKAPLLQVDHLKTHFDVTKGLFSTKQIVKAVDDVSFYVGEGETYGLVGESGCGKSTLGRTLVKIYPATGGKVLYKGQDIARLGKEEEKHFRKEVQMIFQDPYASLNPRMTVGEIIKEPMEIHGILDSSKDREDRAAELLKTVGLKPDHIRRYPHEFSGGQRQRIAVARALITRPDVVICDEPVSALDASVQAQILNLLRDVQEHFGPAYFFISHDLAVVGFLCSRIAVMYLGQIVEEAPAGQLFSGAAHPYTRALMAAMPSGESGGRLAEPLEGELPSPLDPPAGCRFHPRCPLAQDVCRNEAPVWKECAPGWRVRCWLA